MTGDAAAPGHADQLRPELDRIHHDLAQVRGALCDLFDFISDQRRPVPVTASRRRRAAPPDRHLRLVRDRAV